MPVRLNSSGGGSVTLDVPATAGTFTLNLPATDGSVVAANNSGLVNFSQRPTVNGAPIGINLATAQASTSGTFIDFTGIPAGVRRITVMFNGVSTNGSSNLLVQLGTSGGVTTTGYQSAIHQFSNSNASSTAGFILTSSISTAAQNWGSMIISNVSSNTWVEQCGIAVFGTSGTSGGGGVTLAAVLDRVRITTVNGTDIFDAGSINVAWEF
ncbi:hypothetical protein UFOVP397_5 [uncultured Caudovirales phage]|uniref:Uncharacterized protein n=1 Tax=uncultured Caudovirales phage TaxID=2100421 RepID=A0A6J5M831_9CAUD|nr:hypothetical protein UFOVP397_5 [uncultured Caudovirales phage]